MRIMHISTRLILGGSQENTVLSCEGQAELGHDVSLVYGPIYGPEGSMLERVEKYRTSNNQLINLIETPNLVRQLSPWHDRKCLHDLRQIIRAEQPDIVHTHSSKAGILGRIAAWRERVPAVIHTIHGLPFHPYQAKWRNAIYIASERFAAKRCHRIVCVADAMRDQALAAGIGRVEQYRTVYSGMEIDQFLNPQWDPQDVRDSLGVSENDFIVGTIARLAELKGHDDLLNALGSTMQKNANIKLLWVGDGWWKERLLSQIESLELQDQVILPGLVPSDEVPRFLQAMDVLVHPSYREGLPRTVPQALLSNRPVIAYDVDGSKEVCIDGETGRLVKPGDHAGLRDAVLWMMNHPDERKALAVAGQALCRDRFAAETMVKELQQIYETCLDETSSTYQ